jgi:hypothetical protein
MKIASIVAVAIVVAAAFYFSRTGHPPCADNILTFLSATLTYGRTASEKKHLQGGLCRRHHRGILA